VAGHNVHRFVPIDLSLIHAVCPLVPTGEGEIGIAKGGFLRTIAYFFPHFPTFLLRISGPRLLIEKPRTVYGGPTLSKLPGFGLCLQ
jgi:hypothetical protein